jgi:hypothetical protein
VEDNEADGGMDVETGTDDVGGVRNRGTSSGSGSGSSSNTKKSHRAVFQPGRINRFAKVSFPLFEAQRRNEAGDDTDYGMSITDIFPENVKEELDTGAAGLLKTPAVGALAAVEEMKEEDPVKIVRRKMRVQFTCSFVEIEGGRALTASLRTLLSTVRPQRVIFMRQSKGGAEMRAHAASLRLSADCIMCAKTGTTYEFPLLVQSLRLKVPAAFFTVEMQSVSNDKGTSTCQVAAVGSFSKVGACSKGADGVYSVGLISSTQSPACVAVGQNGMDVEGGEGTDGVEVMMEIEGGGGDDDDAEDVNDAGNPLQAALLCGEAAPAGMQIGAVSVGEITLEALQKRIQDLGVRVTKDVENLTPFLLCEGGGGGGDGCNQGVRVTKDKDYENSFNLDGPPSPTLYLVRQVLYELYAFI